MTEEEVIRNPLVKCAGCGDLVSLHPDLHRHYQPVMLYGEIYHSRCLPKLKPGMTVTGVTLGPEGIPSRGSDGGCVGV
jgi:hypothetical protein